MKTCTLVLIYFVAHVASNTIDTSKRLQKIFNNKMFVFDDSENTIPLPYVDFIVTDYRNKTSRRTYQKNPKDIYRYHDNNFVFWNLVITEKVDEYKKEINLIYPKMSNSNFLQAVKNGVETLHDEERDGKETHARRLSRGRTNT